MSLSLRLRNLLCLCLPLTAALGAAAADVYPVVAEGENAPEALVRITGVRPQGTGRYDVTAVQGPCRSGPGPGGGGLRGDGLAAWHVGVGGEGRWNHPRRPQGPRGGF